MFHNDLPDPKQQPDGTWAVQYSTKDDKGKILTTTTFTGTTERECWKKMQAAHVEASETIVRLRARVQSQRPTDLGTPEEEARKSRVATNFANEKAESLKFLHRHLYTGDYFNCDGNNRMMYEYCERHNLPWVIENIEVAFTELTRQGKLALEPAKKIEDAPEETSQEVAPLADMPWSPNPLRSKKDVADLGRSFKEFLMHKNPQIRAEFQRQLNAIGIRS